MKNALTFWESRQATARFWSAPALWRFGKGSSLESGTGVPQSRTQAHTQAQCRLDQVRSSYVSLCQVEKIKNFMAPCPCPGRRLQREPFKVSQDSPHSTLAIQGYSPIQGFWRKNYLFLWAAPVWPVKRGQAPVKRGQAVWRKKIVYFLPRRSP
jgi:hypothetical protein